MPTAPRALAVLTLGLSAGAALLAAPAAAQPVPTHHTTSHSATTRHAAAHRVTAAAAATGYTDRADWESAVLAQLNSERAQNGLAPLRRSAKLDASAHAHDLAMAKVDTLSHQLTGEASLGARVTATGYTWSSCGENIAWNSRRSQAGVLAVQTSMYNETPPNDGHRRNILSTGFTEVGVDVVDDSVHGKVWLTTDFGRPR